MSNSFLLSCQINSELEKEVALAAALNHGTTGCEEKTRDKNLLLDMYFNSRSEAQRTRSALTEAFPGRELKLETVEHGDWNAKWREQMKPARLTDKVWAAPVWRPPDMEENDIWIRIEPKMAFGTGHHESTQLPAQAIHEMRDDLKGKWFLDIGAGSGILCFLADILGAEKSWGIENDPVCLENLLENQISNTMQGDVRFIMGPASCLRQPAEFDIMAVNMIRTRSIPVIEQCSNVIKPGGLCIWSGLQLEEHPLALEFISKLGWTLEKEIKRNNWWCGVLKKPNL